MSDPRNNGNSGSTAPNPGVVMDMKETNAKYFLSAERQLPKGYKQTEVGVIPEDWEIIPLAKLAEIRTGIAKNSNVEVGNPVQVYYLRVANVQDGFLDISDLKTLKINRNNIKRYEVLPGDVLMNEGGDLDKLGRGSIWRGEFAPCVHQNHVFVVRCNSKLSPDYLNAWTGAKPARRYFMVAGKQTTNLATINKTALGLLPIVLSTKAEQEAIAEALSDADALIEALEQLVVKKRQLKQGAMQELLTGKRRLPGFRGEWVSKRLGDTAILKARIGWQGLTTAEYRETGDYHLVTGTEFKNGYIDWNDCVFVDESRYKQDRNIQLKIQDVLVTKDGTIGKVALINTLPLPATLNSGVFVIRPITNAFQPEFFYFLLCSTAFTEFLSQLSAGSTINHLYQKDFVTFIYKTPPTSEEQTAIAQILSEMDAEIAELESKLAKARAAKQGMMQQLLTGKIRLVVNPKPIIDN